MDERGIQFYSNRAERYHEQGEYQKAIDTLTLIINAAEATDKQKAGAYANRGIAYGKQRKYEQAIANFTEAIELFTDNNKAKAYKDRGNAYYEQEKYAEAIDDFTKGIELATDKDDKANAYYNRGLTYNKQGKYEQAIDDFTQATELYKVDNDKAEAYNNRGVAYAEQREYAEAIADYKNALDLNPELKEAKLNLSIVEIKKEQEEFRVLSGEARSISLAKEYEAEQDKLKKDMKKWTLLFAGGIVLLVLIPVSIIFNWIPTITNKDSFSLTTILIALPLLAPIIWLTSFFAKRRSEANMLLQEYTHKTIFAKSYIAYKKAIEGQGSQTENLLPKLLEATIDTIKRSPTYIFSKKHSNDLPIEELKQIIELAKTLKN